MLNGSKRIFLMEKDEGYMNVIVHRVEVKKRFSSMSLRSLGMYPGAMVTRRKPDWEYGDQDGNRICQQIIILTYMCFVKW